MFYSPIAARVPDAASSLLLVKLERGLSVCLSVCLYVCLCVCVLVSTVSAEKTAEPIEMLSDPREPRETCVKWGPVYVGGKGILKGTFITSLL